MWGGVEVLLWGVEERKGGGGGGLGVVGCVGGFGWGRVVVVREEGVGVEGCG